MIVRRRRGFCSPSLPIGRQLERVGIYLEKFTWEGAPRYHCYMDRPTARRFLCFSLLSFHSLEKKFLTNRKLFHLTWREYLKTLQSLSWSFSVEISPFVYLSSKLVWVLKSCRFVIINENWLVCRVGRTGTWPSWNYHHRPNQCGWIEHAMLLPTRTGIECTYRTCPTHCE